jgi:hypothetical protein
MLFATKLLLVSWTLSQSSRRRLLPFSTSATFTKPNASFPPGMRAESGLAGFDTAAAARHLVYLIALTFALAVLAVLRDAPRRRLAGAGCAALALVFVTAALQLA